MTFGLEGTKCFTRGFLTHNYDHSQVEDGELCGVNTDLMLPHDESFSKRPLNRLHESRNTQYGIDFNRFSLHQRISFNFVFCCGVKVDGNFTLTSTIISPLSCGFLLFGIPKSGKLIW